MFKPYKSKLILSSVLILLPILFGLLRWNDLPASMVTHWGMDGVADGFSGKFFGVFAMPLMLLAGHWFCLWWTLRDPKNQNQTPKALGMIFWIMPCVSLFANGMLYSVSLGHNLSMANLMPALLGLMFAVVGNYLPKCRQNRSLGIKLPWTFHTEENWNRTHRLGGRIWVIGGLLIIFAVLLPLEIGMYVTLISILALCFIPCIYSYLLYRKQVKNHEIPAIAPGQFRSSKWVGVILVVTFAAIAILMFTGDIKTTLGENTLNIDATYWHGLTVEYAVIDQIEYRTDLDVGMRINGFGSARLQLGLFQNSELGSYTRYGYTGSNASLLITCGDDALVIALRDPADTETLYQQILEKIK